MALGIPMKLIGAGAALLASATPWITPCAAAEPAPRISGPIVHNNVALYLVHGKSAPGPVPQTLQEAMAKGTVVVHETGNVQRLEIENKGSEAVFVQFGDIVKGGQQDRVLTVSLLLDPKSGRVPIGAYCVEQGRWSARGTEAVKQFALSEALMPSREAKLAMAQPAKPATAPQARAAPQTQESVARQGAANRAQDGARIAGSEQVGQAGVWRSVKEVQDLLGQNLTASVRSEKSATSLQLALEHEKLKTAQSDYLARLEPRGLEADDVIGVVVAVNGRLSSADVYPSNGLFRKMWPKIVRAAATEALSAKAPSPGSPAQPAGSGAIPPLTIEAVSGFLANAEQGKASENIISGLAKIETREAEKALRIEARNSRGDFVHRNYVAK